MRVRVVLALMVQLAAWVPLAEAQVDQVTTPPPNLVLSNYNSVPVGPFGGLEGSAYVARVGDPSAAWFNPAGLARQDTPQISGSAGVYQWTSVAPQAVPNRGGSVQQLPNAVGFTIAPTSTITAGVALLTTNAWNQETDSELIAAVPGGQQRFAYSADSDYQQRVIALGAGYRASGQWRFGGGVAISIMSLRLVQTASDRLADASTLKSLLVTARASSSAIQLRSQGGVQFDTGRWRFGAAVRTPGATILRSGSVTFDAVYDAGASSSGASLFDADAESAHRLPWEFQAGAAWSHSRVELELNVIGYAPISAYALVSTDQPVRVYSVSGANQPPAVQSQPFAGLTSASGGVVNVGAGGHVKVLADRDLRIHAGVSSNQSPVAAEDTVFSNVDLITWTLGVSGALGKFRFAAGFNHQSGTANDLTLRNLIDGRAVQSSIRVGMGGFIYSLAYQF
jgi:hypothetical protein